ncbi:MAG: hypothetical protein OXJ90_08110 [Spirochaetaceae bacterium]|nr:hypothetical protein [Spirochaetaceae bacterium]
MSRLLAGRDFAVDAGGRTGTATANVIGNPAATRHLTETVEVRDGRAHQSRRRTCCRWPWLERHHGTDRGVNAFVQGFGLDAACEVATTVAHDCHHLLVTGTCAANMGP